MPVNALCCYITSEQRDSMFSPHYDRQTHTMRLSLLSKHISPPPRVFSLGGSLSDSEASNQGNPFYSYGCITAIGAAM